MTPLAARLALQLNLPIKQRLPFWQDKEHADFLRQFLYDVHCFEITKVLPLAKEIDALLSEDEEAYGQHIFLPAPNTWIEMIGTHKRRFAISLRELRLSDPDVRRSIPEYSGPLRDVAAFFLVYDTSYVWTNIWLLLQSMEMLLDPQDKAGYEAKYANKMWSLAAYLALINSPKIVQRKLFWPHKRLERELIKAKPLIGKFPLHAYTDIRLKVTKPIEIDDGQAHEAHLTGQRALHFVRKFMRVRFGTLEYVKAHWRGNPALGIKRSRYLVEP